MMDNERIIQNIFNECENLTAKELEDLINNLKQLIELKNEDLEEFQNEVINVYDEYLVKTEKRGISWGEIAYIQNMNENELKEFFQELEKETQKC